MKKLDMVQGSLELLVSIGVGMIAGNAVNLVKPQNLGILKKIVVGIGGLAISSMAADKVTDYFDDEWTKTVEQIKDLFKKKEPNKE